jgi:hypothetical protein
MLFKSITTSIRRVLFSSAALLCGIALFSNAIAVAQSITSPIYELRSYVSEPGRQAEVLKLIAEGGVPTMAKHNITFVGAWTNIEASDERVFTLLRHKDKATCDANWTAFQNDEDWKATLQKSGVDGKRPVKSFERVFLSVNDYSPALEVKDVGNRVFELRTYVVTKGNLPALNARFKNHTLGLFTKHGMTNVLYCSVLDGESLTCSKLLEAVSPVGKANADVDANAPAAGNSLVYFITHTSKEAAAASFAKFGADEEWKAAYKASQDAAGGSLTVKDGVKSIYLKPTSFSLLK